MGATSVTGKSGIGNSDPDRRAAKSRKFLNRLEALDELGLLVSGIGEIDLSSLSDGDILVYDATNEKWKSIPAGGSGPEINLASGVYVAATKSIVFTLTDSSNVSVNVSDLLTSNVGSTMTGDGDTSPLEVNKATGLDIASATPNKILDASAVIDEDSFASNSNQKVPTQQSVKAYVDSQVGGGSSGVVTFTQPTASTTWTINHNLGKIPVIQTYDSSMKRIYGSETPVDFNTTVIEYNVPVSGVAQYTA